MMIDQLTQVIEARPTPSPVRHNAPDLLEMLGLDGAA